MRTTLESGAWVEHTPIQDLVSGHRRKLSRAGKSHLHGSVLDAEGNVNVGAMLAGTDISSWLAAKQDALWALLITGWSYDLPVPELDSEGVSGGESFDAIPLADYDEIEALFEPFAAKLNRQPDPKAQAAATTTASNGSSRASAAHGSRTA
jgi:hypothetical protein